ncbi:MAG: adenylate/guanylate cyclase domain-containing protein [Candidatus Electrothrix sp. MAN1_4]|nr:adenylate/guanylate cyclase domain-containing protein [Candidatus Electrothrix sp. MAN1_4]
MCIFCIGFVCLEFVLEISVKGNVLMDESDNMPNGELPRPDNKPDKPEHPNPLQFPHSEPHLYNEENNPLVSSLPLLQDEPTDFSPSFPTPPSLPDHPQELEGEGPCPWELINVLQDYINLLKLSTLEELLFWMNKSLPPGIDSYCVGEQKADKSVNPLEIEGSVMLQGLLNYNKSTAEYSCNTAEIQRVADSKGGQREDWYIPLKNVESGKVIGFFAVGVSWSCFRLIPTIQKKINEAKKEYVFWTTRDKVGAALLSENKVEASEVENAKFFLNTLLGTHLSRLLLLKRRGEQLATADGQLAAARANIKPLFSETIFKELDLFKDHYAAPRYGDKWVSGAAVLMTDVRGCTGILSETLRSQPHNIPGLFHSMFGRLAAIVHDCHGVVNDYSGDGMLAYFIESDQIKRNIKSAIKAAIKMQEGMCSLQENWEATRQPILEIGIAVHCGGLFRSAIGQELIAYTVIGDTINYASRLCENTPAGKVFATKDIQSYEKELSDVCNFTELPTIPPKHHGENSIDCFRVDPVRNRA